MPTPTDQTLLIFRIAGIACAVPAESVGSIVMPPAHLTHPPGSGRSTPGIFHHADYTYSVIDLHERFGIDTPRKGGGRLLLKDEGIRHFAFQVDEVVGLVDSVHGQWAALPPYLPNTIFWSGFLYKKEIVLCTELQSLRTMHDAAPLQRHFEMLQQQAQKERNGSVKRPPSHADGRRKEERPTPISEKVTQSTGAGETGSEKSPSAIGSSERKPPAAAATGVVPGASAREAASTPATPSRPTQGRPPRSDTSRVAPPREPSRSATPPPSPEHRPPPRVQATTSPVGHGGNRGNGADSPARPTTTPRRPLETPSPTAKAETVAAGATAPARAVQPTAPSQTQSEPGGSGGLWLIALLLLLLLSAGVYWLWPEPPQKRTIAYAPSQATTPAPAPSPAPAEVTPPPIETPASKPEPTAAEAAEEEVPMRIERDQEGTLNIIFDRRAIARQEPAVPPPEETAESPEVGMTPLEGEAGMTPLPPERETPLLNEAEQVAAADSGSTAPEADGATGEEAGAEATARETTPEAATPQEPDVDWAEPPAVEPCECLHIVVRGDTLWDIAARYTGSAWNYPELARRSGITNPDLIYPGDKVRIIIR